MDTRVEKERSADFAFAFHEKTKGINALLVIYFLLVLVLSYPAIQGPGFDVFNCAIYLSILILGTIIIATLIVLVVLKDVVLMSKVRHQNDDIISNIDDPQQVIRQAVYSSRYDPEAFPHHLEYFRIGQQMKILGYYEYI